jgi:DNA polymerase-1
VTVNLSQFTGGVWLVDFEFGAGGGELPEVRCMVAKNYLTGQIIALWVDELGTMQAPPFPIDSSAVLVAYFASAEMGCFLALNWPMPVYVLDLFTEFRCLTNGRGGGAALLDVLQYYGIPSIDAAEKASMRELALRGSDYTESEKSALLDYCASDVLALEKLLPRMLPSLSLPHALHRGEYMKASAHIEHHGVPIDMDMLALLRERWDAIKVALISAIDADYHVFEGTTFKTERWEQYLIANDIPWPRLESGKLDLSDDTFRQMAKAYPQIAPMQELRASLSALKLNDLAVGVGGRNRCLLSPFRAMTGRNQPSSAKFIFGPAVWIRGLIKPSPGYGIAYIDWSQQEFGIAAALSGDTAMQDAYTSGDPYLTFAIQAGLAPVGATKQTHRNARELCKQCILGVQYGMGARSLSVRIGKTESEAKHLLALHRQTYPVFWTWSDAAVDMGMLHGKISTVFGWECHTTVNSNPRSLRNFPMQANGAEMLRRACIIGIQRGVKICAPVHDALLIEAPLDVLDDHIEHMQGAMAQASRDVLNGFELRSGVEKFTCPDCYMDERGKTMWNRVMELVGRAEQRV